MFYPKRPWNSALRGLGADQKSDGGKDRKALRWLVTYNKKAVSNDVVETGCLVI